MSISVMYSRKPEHKVFIDDFLEKHEHMKEMEMYCEVLPKDENDVFVPIAKEAGNIEKVNETLNEAYGLDLD